MNAMLPIIEQMHNAEDNRARARILLRCPDMVLIKYREVFDAACRRAGFEAGSDFIELRRSTWHAIRDADGRLDDPLFEQAREAFARYADGEIG